MIMEDDVTIIRAKDTDFVEMPLPGSKGILTRLIKVDEENDQIVMHVRFLPGAKAPRHYHYCRAVAYTMSGEWEYDNGKFGPGDVAYEETGNVHTPSSEKGGEIVLFLSSDDGRYLDNYMVDGSIVRYTIDTFKFFEGKTQEDIEKMSLAEMFSKIEFIPSPGKRLRDAYHNLVQELRA